MPLPCPARVVAVLVSRLSSESSRVSHPRPLSMKALALTTGGHSSSSTNTSTSTSHPTGLLHITLTLYSWLGLLSSNYAWRSSNPTISQSFPRDATRPPPTDPRACLPLQSHSPSSNRYLEQIASCSEAEEHHGSKWSCRG